VLSLLCVVDSKGDIKSGQCQDRISLKRLTKKNVKNENYYHHLKYIFQRKETVCHLKIFYFYLDNRNLRNLSVLVFADF
jgi:hypothetical protein